MSKLQELKEKGEAPEWLTDEGFSTLCNGYLLQNETPRQMYRRVAKAAANKLLDPSLENRFYNIINRNWLCLATPVASNMGTDRGLPISCFGQSVEDSTINIFDKIKETALLTKYGGVIGKDYDNVRARGVKISKGGVSEGVIPWLKIEEATINAVSQAGVRRGAEAIYLSLEHGDADEFLDIRRPTGDPSRRCLSTSFHHGIKISDNFLNEAMDGNKKNRELWEKVLKTRIEMGEPYTMFTDNANRNLFQGYINNGLTIKTSQLCNEIYLYNDKDHTFVCCLSSLNLERYDEWKDTDVVELSIKFLDAVMEEFIQKAKSIEGLENAVRFSEKSRALGLGVLGWHTLLQKKLIPFDSFQAMQLNAEIFSLLKNRSEAASRELAENYGEPEWCKGTGFRNSHRLAVAPTVSNSLISGGVSQGIEPIVSNYFAQRTAKGTFIRKNKQLELFLKIKGKNVLEVWEQINKDKGSVKNLKFMTDEEKSIFETAREINQFAIVRQAGQRQKFIDQGASTNLFFTVPSDIGDDSLRKKLGKYIHDVHIEAWKLGVKGLYYCRAESPLKGDNIFREEGDCKACEG